MKKITIALGILALIVLVAYTQRVPLLTRVMEKGLETRMGQDRLDELDDGLHLALCGAGGPMPAPNASGPCVVVVAGKQLFLVDAGTDGIRNLARMGFQPGTISAVFLTHFHSDHIDGLGEVATIRWAGGGNKTPLPVFGPRGVKQIVNGFNLAYQQDTRYRNAHHGNLVADLNGAGLEARNFKKPADGALVTVYEQDGLKVEALAVDHAPVEPAVGYRFSYGGRTLLISGDTAYAENVAKFAQGVDLLVHEALAPNLVKMMNEAAIKNGNEVMAKVTADIPSYHASPVEVAQLARDANVGKLLYYHIVPPLVFPGQEALFLNGAGEIFPDYTIGKDGTSYSLPSNSTAILQTHSGL